MALAQSELPVADQYKWMPVPLVTSVLLHPGASGSPLVPIFSTPDMDTFVGDPPGIDNGANSGNGALAHDCCYHNVFVNPPGFSGLRVFAFHDDTGNNGTFDLGDHGGADPEPLDHVVILGSDNGFTALRLTPFTETRSILTQHTVIARIVGPVGFPKANILVNFEVISGPNVGTTGTGTTNSNGEAPFSYFDTGGSPNTTDTIVARSTFGPPPPVPHISNTVVVNWVDPPADPVLTLTPSTATNTLPADNMHTVTAPLTLDGIPVIGEIVTFGVTGTNTNGGTCVTLSPDGSCTFTYPGSVEGDDAITADASVGGVAAATAEAAKTWVDGGCPSNMKKKGKKGKKKSANNCNPSKKKKKKGKKSKKKKSDRCGGVASMMLTYTGGGTAVVMVTTKGTAVPGSPFTVAMGDTFTIDGTGLRKGKLESSTIVSIMSGASVDIHTSCSKPIMVGDEHGDFKITGLTLLP